MSILEINNQSITLYIIARPPLITRLGPKNITDFDIGRSCKVSVQVPKVTPPRFFERHEGLFLSDRRAVIMVLMENRDAIRIDRDDTFLNKVATYANNELGKLVTYDDSGAPSYDHFSEPRIILAQVEQNTKGEDLLDDEPATNVDEEEFSSRTLDAFGEAIQFGFVIKTKFPDEAHVAARRVFNSINQV